MAVNGFPELPKLKTPQLNVNNTLPHGLILPGVPQAGQLVDFPEPGFVRRPTESPTVMFDMYDPDQINSFADVFYRFLDTAASDNIFEAVGGSFKDMWTLTKGTFAPLTQAVHEEGLKGLTSGRALAATGINSLVSVSETLDMFANPVKGMFLEEDGAWEGFKRGSIGRETYEYDTGNLATDIFLEVISDPITVVSLGSAGLVRGLAKTGVNVTDDILQEVGEETFEKGLKSFIRAFDGDVDDAVASALKNRFIRSLDEPTQAMFADTLKHNTNINVLKSIGKVRKVTDFVDRELLQLSLAYTPRLAKNIGVGGVRYVNGAIMRSVEKYIPEGGQLNLFNLAQGLDEVDKTITSLKNIKALDVTGLNTKLVVRSQATNDLDSLRKIITDHYSNMYELKTALDDFAQKGGAADFAEYSKTIAQLDESTNISKLNRLRNQLDHIQDSYTEVQRQIQEDILMKQRSVLAENTIAKYSEDLIGLGKGYQAELSVSELDNTIKNYGSNIFNRLMKTNLLDNDTLINLTRNVVDVVNTMKRTLKNTYYLQINQELNSQDFFKIISRVYDSVDELSIDLSIEERGQLIDAIYDVIGEPLENLQSSLIADGINVENITEEPLIRFIDGFIQAIESFQTPGDLIDNKFYKRVYNNIQLSINRLEKIREHLINTTYTNLSALNKQYANIMDAVKTTSEALSSIQDKDLIEQTNKLLKERLTHNTTAVFNDIITKELSDIDKFLKSDAYRRKFNDLLNLEMVGEVDLILRESRLNEVHTLLKELPETGNSLLDRRIKALMQELSQRIDEIIKGSFDNQESLFTAINDLVADIEYTLKQYDEFLDENIAKKHVGDKILPVRNALKTQYFDPIRDLLDDIEIDFMPEQVYELKRDLVRYVLKESNLRTALELFNNPGLDNLFQNKLFNEQFIQTLMESPIFVNDMAGKMQLSRIMVRIEDLMHTRDLYNTILNHPDLSKNARDGLFDTIQNLYNKNLYKAIDDPSYVLKDIHDVVETNIRSVLKTEQLNLEALYQENSRAIHEFIDENYPEIIEQIRQDNPLDPGDLPYEDLAHDARFDVLVTRWLMDNEGINTGRTVIFDIEATGLDVQQGERLLQLTWMTPDGVLHNRNIKPSQSHRPTQDIMIKLLGSPAKDLDPTALHQAYLQKFSANAVDEDQAIREFLEDVVASQGTGMDLQDVYLSGHNINRYDLDFLITRSKEMGVVNRDIFYQESIKTRDTLEHYFDELDIFVLTKEEQEIVNNIVRKHLQTMENSPMNIMHRELTEAGVLDDLIRNRKIITNPDRDFAADISSVTESIHAYLKSDRSSDELYQQVQRLTQGDAQSSILHFANSLNDVGSEVFQTLNQIKATNRLLGLKYTDKLDGTLVDFSKYGNIMQVLNANNVDIEKGQLKNLQSLATRKVLDTNDLLNYYPHLVDAEISTSLKDNMSRVVRRLKQLRRQFTNEALITRIFTEDWDEAKQLFTILKTRYTAATPLTTTKAIEQLVFDVNDPRIGLAQLKYLLDKVGALDGAKHLKKIIPNYEQSDLVHFLTDKVHLLKNRVKAVYNLGTYDSYFQINHIDDYSENIQEFIHLKDHIDSIDELLNVIDETKLSNSRVLKRYGILKEIMQRFEHFSNSMKEVFMSKGEDIMEVVKVINDLKAYQDILNVRMVENLQKLTPIDLKSYLWNNAKGVVVLDLELGSRGQLIKNSFFDNLDRYHKAGIKSYQNDRTLILYLDNTFSDFNLSRQVNLPEVDRSFRNMKTKPWYVRQYDQARESLLKNVPEARGTEFEMMNKSKYYELVKRLPEDVQKDLISFTTLNTHGKFFGLNFNYSVYGRKHYKREWLDYIYNNPFKNLYYTAQETAKISDFQTRYIHSLTEHDMNLGSDLMKQFSNEDILKVLEDNPQLKIGALVKDKKTGFRFQEFTAFKPKDIERLRELNAVIIPQHLMNKSKSYINNDKITQPLVQFFNKYIVGLTKTGMLSALGFLLRNIFDSNSKNILSQGPDIAKTTFQTVKYYQEFMQIKQEIFEKYGRISKDNIARFFSDYDGKMGEELFYYIDEFIVDGPSAGLSKAMQEKIGNVYQKLWRRSEYKDYLEWQDIRDFILYPKNRVPSKWDPRLFQELQRLQGEYDIYHKAYAMMEHTRHAELKLDNIVYYLRNPKELPSHLKSEFKRIKKFEPTSRAVQKIDKYLFENILSRSVMNMNAHMEQIVRLSNYLHEILEKGSTVSEAMYSVVRNHFDTIHKTYNQELLEMFFPFSVFRLNNIRYWAEALEEHPEGMKFIAELIEGNVDLESYSEWDLANRRSLQYHILNGSVIIDEDTGLNVKLSPSVLDAFSALYNPLGTAVGSLVPVIQTPIDLAYMEKEDWMDQEYYERSRREKLISMIPLIGPAAIRTFGAERHAERTGSIAPRIMPSVFGSTNLPSPYNPRMYPRYPRYYSRQRGFSYYTTYNMYSKMYYPETPSAYYQGLYSSPKQMNYSPLLSRRVNRNFRYYNDLYTAKGKNKLDLMMIPPSPGSATYSLRNIWTQWK